MARTGSQLRGTVMAMDACYALAAAVGFPAVIAVGLAYARKNDATGTVWESHFTYAIRTFWIGIGLFVLAVLAGRIGFGWPAFLFLAVWYVVRVSRAFLAWSSEVPIAAPQRFF